METIISIFPNAESIANTRQKLEKVGLVKDEITLLVQPGDVWLRLGGRHDIWTVIKYGFVGALLGLILFSLSGAPKDAFNCEIINCSLATRMLSWASASRNWVIAFGILGIILGLRSSVQYLFPYIKGVLQGAALIVVETPEDKAAEARRILRQEHAAFIHTRHAQSETAAIHPDHHHF